MAIEELKVGGSIKLKGPLKAGVVKIGGSLKVDGDLDVDSLDVGGSCKISGNLKAREVVVGGAISIDGNALVEQLFRVGGSADITGDLEAGEVDVGGSLKSRIVKSKIFRLSGGARVERVIAEDVEIGRDSEVYGVIIGCRVVIRKKAEVEEVIGYDVKVERDAEIDRLEAYRVVVEDGAQVDELLYVEKAEIGEDAEVKKLVKAEKLSVELKCGVS